MPTHKHQAIILKRINLGEADRIVTAFSKSSGKIRFVAKGVRRTKSKFSGSIEPFCLSDLIITDGKSLDILTSASIIKNFIGFEPSLEQIKTATLVAEIVDKNLPDEIESKKIFDLISEVLNHLNKGKLDYLKIYFLINFFDFLGVNIETNCCIKCNNKPSDKIFISKQAGGILDLDCAMLFSDSKHTEVEVIKTLRLPTQLSLENFLKISIPDKTIKEALTFCLNYSSFITGKNLKSVSI